MFVRFSKPARSGGMAAGGGYDAEEDERSRRKASSPDGGGPEGGGPPRVSRAANQVMGDRSTEVIASSRPPSLARSSTTPQYSCPIGVGPFIGCSPRYGHRSDPDTHVAAMLIPALVGCSIFGVSRSSNR